ncbi:hypothetical protein CUMW_168920 [Citrus unshiu]|uniref:Uncharacterized protein n=1 Tax=Citrus unshiu TaxID=55188 RepID=A0A2H5PUL8_CITUN|nr:hypothetical protein CUMW_168920 [Citrus unshiu]
MKKFIVLIPFFTFFLCLMNLSQGQLKFCTKHMTIPGVCPKDPKEAEFVCLKAFFDKYGATKSPDNCLCKPSTGNQHICQCDIICDPPPPKRT